MWILNDADAQILSFRKRPDDEKPLVVNKSGSVQGRLYLVGGKDETVPVRLEGASGETLYCEASTEMAQQLSALLFKQVRVSVRASGSVRMKVRGSSRSSKLNHFRSWIPPR